MLHERVSHATLGIVRVAVFGMWLKHLLQDPVERYLRAPLEAFEPIAPLVFIPASWWPWLYRTEVLEWGRIVLWVAIGASMLGLRPYRPIALATCVGLTVYQAFVRSYGYVFHGEMIMLLAAYVLAIYPADRGFALGRKALASPAGSGDSLDRAAMLTLSTILCLTYFLVGMTRFVGGGIEIFRDGTILHYIARYSFANDVTAPGIGAIVLEVPVFGTLAAVGFAVTSCFELLSPLAIFWRRFRWAWIAAILGFHVAAGVLMNIWFTANMAMVLLCMTDLEKNLAHLNAILPRVGLRPLSFLPGASRTDPLP